MPTCPSCQQPRDTHQLREGRELPASLVQSVQRNHPNWTPEETICEICVHNAMADEAQAMLEHDMGELSDQEEMVIESLRDGEMMAVNVFQEDEQDRTSAEQWADRIADIIGTWRFSALVLVLVMIWIAMNILTGQMMENVMLTLGVISATLGTLAAIQGPIILMSQRRAAKRDRLRAENDYRVNLKAQLEVHTLNEKIDHLVRLQLENTDRITQLEAQARQNAGIESSP